MASSEKSSQLESLSLSLYFVFFSVACCWIGWKAQRSAPHGEVKNSLGFSYGKVPAQMGFSKGGSPATGGLERGWQ